MTDLVYNCGDNQFNVTMPAHHKAHEWSNTVVGSDVINVHPRMFSLLRTTVVPNSILVKTSSFYYVKDNTMTVFPESTTNLTSYIPAGTNMVRLVLVGLNTASNTISVSAGVPTFNSAVTPPPFPTIPTNVLPSALVRLVSGSVTISEKDVSDARVFLNASVGGSGGWPLNRVLTVSLSNPGADYSSIDSALAGASNGDTLVLDSETFTISSTLAINKDITLTGNGTIEGTADPVIDIGANVVTVRGLTIRYVGTGTGTVITSDNNCTVTIDDCKIEITSNSVTVGTGIKPNNGTWNLINNTNISITGSGSKYGILNDASIGILNVNVMGCSVWGLTNDIRVAGNAVVRLVGTVVTGNTMAVPGSGSIAGWYYWATSGVAYFLHTQFSGTPIQIGANQVVMPSGSSISAGIWLLDASATVKTRYSTLASAITAASAGDTILIYPGTYSGSVTVDKAISLVGIDAQTTIITSPTASTPTIDITADGVRLQNLTITHTGAGTTAGIVATDNNNVVLDNCILTKSSGSASVSYGFWMYGAGSATLQNCQISVTAGSVTRGLMTTLGDGSVTIDGGSLDSVYSDQTGAILMLRQPVVTTISWAGILLGEWMNSSGVSYIPQSNDTFSPQTFSPNYIISPSVSSNNLTVALKTIDNNDPTPGSPVVVRVGNSIVSITGALSTTKNAGTNWCNAGSAELATQSVDYFVYLINETGAASGTKLGFSRIPYARTMGDFVNTTTNEKYIAGNWTNFNSSDAVTVIGRFAAALSATNNWSGASQVVNYPIYESRWLSYVPTVSSGSGSITTVGSRSGFYKVDYDTLFLFQATTITTNGTGAGWLNLTTPLTVAATSILTGREYSVGGAMLQGVISASTNVVTWTTYNNAYPGGNGYSIFGGPAPVRLS